MDAAQHNQIDSIFLKLGLTGPFIHDEYSLTMERRFGRKADRFMQAVDDAYDSFDGPTAETWKRLYQLKNADKDMSVFISAHQCTTLYKAFLTWLLDHLEEEPERVIELGCENGLLTLAIGSLLPNSDVLGIDIVGKAISNAKQLRKKFQLNNSEFRMADLTKPMEISQPQADLIVASWVMHELLPCTINGGSISKGEQTFLANLAGLIRSGGSLVSVNRFPFADSQVPKLSDSLATVGFEQTLQTTIAAEEGEVTSRFPIVCFEKLA